MGRPARALLDAQALRQNFQQVRARAPHARVMAVVKANGYGHGLTWVAQTLKEADAFCVASIEEGFQLRQAGIPQPIDEDGDLRRLASAFAALERDQSAGFDGLVSHPASRNKDNGRGILEQPAKGENEKRV